MSVPSLPREVWSGIICQRLHNASLKECLELRCVNSIFDQEVMYALFILRVKSLGRATKHLIIPHNVAFLQLQGFFAQKDVPRKQHKQARRAILRAADHDPRLSISDTCFSYRPNQPCSHSLSGSSSSIPTCTAHNMLNALVHAQNSDVFVWGTDRDVTDDIFAATDPRVWQAILATYKNDHARVRDILREMTAEEAVNDGVRFFNRCMLIATRTNNPSMITTFREELHYPEDTRYYQRSLDDSRANHNCLNESIRLGYLDVFSALLQWNWKFEHPEWSLHHYLCHILEAQHLSQSQREAFFAVILDRTEQWRDIGNMKRLLIFLGLLDYQWAFEILLRVLKSQHFYRHAHGDEGLSGPKEPLSCLASSGNLEMIKLYLDNRTILFPIMEPDKDSLMRQSVVEQELLSESPRIPVIKLLVEYSKDLVDQQQNLIGVLINPDIHQKKLENWAWLALKLGLKTIRVAEPPSSLGAILLRDAVSTLNVECVRFLVNNGVWLESDANTAQVYEDDEDMMQRLEIVQKLLTTAGQGRSTKRRTIETTFSCAIDSVPKAQRKTIPKPVTKRVKGLGLARGARNVIGTAELHASILDADKFGPKRDTKSGASKTSIRAKINRRSYAAVAAATFAKGTTLVKGSTTHSPTPSQSS